MRRAFAVSCGAVVILLACLLTFDGVMIARDLFFRQFPAGSQAHVLQNGAVEVVWKDLSGEVVNEPAQPLKPAVIPAIAVPFAVIVAIALYGCYEISRKKADLSQLAGGGA